MAQKYFKAQIILPLFGKSILKIKMLYMNKLCYKLHIFKFKNVFLTNFIYRSV